MTEANEIVIHLGGSGYLATYSGPHAECIAELFDTCTLPLPYTASAPLDAVIADIAARHPGVHVRRF